MAEKNPKRKAILTSAKALFTEKGFHKTKMNEIAVNAGVGKGTLYEYFSSKQDIFDEFCIENVNLMRAGIEEISNQETTFKEKIIEMFEKKEKSTELEDITIERMLSHKNVISDKVVKTMMKLIKDVYAMLIKIIDQGKDEGVVDKNIPSEIIACTLIGTMGEYYRLKLLKEYTSGIDDETIFNLLFNGFGVK
ncbi:AcrR family transcriptional regulator [Sedimentibacter acidaminivorans]|jgi:AcrR family transcriptional regulator|uniref:AcrR family transcriptional regulator n=1 Tax=Sedimentibacter acidaminivorans TaxID=913099 RepID=A0ABS4GAH9_9FIRM|nr:TetR/AcrR family transcriptional regulator [Sedimentibacter acidaminivorans]MBP1924681.1 AcrR family transcriptional regulator [Sedimentibacter acidaminivorans]